MIKSLLVTGMAFGIAACALEQPLEYGTTAGMSFEEFRDTVPRDQYGNYVVDWDRIIRSDDELLEFWGNLQQGALAIYSVGGQDVKWNDQQKRNLTYCVGNGFAGQKANVVAAMDA